MSSRMVLSVNTDSIPPATHSDKHASSTERPVSSRDAAAAEFLPRLEHAPRPRRPLAPVTSQPPVRLRGSQRRSAIARCATWWVVTPKSIRRRHQRDQPAAGSSRARGRFYPWPCQPPTLGTSADGRDERELTTGRRSRRLISPPKEAPPCIYEFRRPERGCRPARSKGSSGRPWVRNLYNRCPRTSRAFSPSKTVVR